MAIRWQKAARILIAASVIAFATMVVLAMRHRAGSAESPTDPVRREDPKTISESEGFSHEFTKDGKLISIKAEKVLTYEHGRSALRRVTLSLPDRNGRDVLVTADEADFTQSDTGVGIGVMRGNVVMKTSDGIEVTSNEAAYDDTAGLLKVPGPVEFSRGRMRGRGVGATYDNARDVLWLLSKAHITVAADAGGGGALDATAETAGLARADHYVKLVTAARIISDDRTIEADEITGLLNDAGDTIRQLQLRNRSRLLGGATAQTMTARDIDLFYAPDGRTLQSSRQIENAVVELGGAAGAPPRRVAATTIDMTMTADGAAVSTLTARERVVVDLPPDGAAPGKQIRAATLDASGPAGQGLQQAQFGGGVEYDEVRPAAAKTPAATRTAKSARLIVETKPGFGAVERADFRSGVSFTDGKMTAEAPRALYHLDRDVVDLSPAQGETGPGPVVSDARLTVAARTIQLAPESGRLKAETDIRSILQPQKKAGAGAPAEHKVPSMLKPDQAVTITSNTLDYDGVAVATYTGNALLWQEGSANEASRITADTIVLDDRTGNLVAKGGVRTRMPLTDTDPKTKQKTPTVTQGSADHFVYDDAKRQATYTGSAKAPARLVGAHGDLSGQRIDLFLREGGGELERAEADANVVVVQDAVDASGAHLVYTAATDTYVLTGAPVVVIERDAQGNCKRGEGATLTFRRAEENTQMDGLGNVIPMRSTPIACPAAKR